jgi:hypothetical protein
MKTKMKLFGIIALSAIIVFSFTTCSNSPNTSGRITINNIPSVFNGKYAFVNSTGNPLLLGADKVSTANADNIITCGKISNGSVTLNVWKIEGESYHNYNGTNANVTLSIVILNEPNVSSSASILTSTYGAGLLLAVNFNNGRATVSGATIMPGPAALRDPAFLQNWND